MVSAPLLIVPESGLVLRDLALLLCATSARPVRGLCAANLTQTSPLRTFVSIEFVSLYIGRHQGYGQHSDEDAKCGRKSCDDSNRGHNLHCVYLNTADN